MTTTPATTQPVADFIIAPSGRAFVDAVAGDRVSLHQVDGGQAVDLVVVSKQPTPEYLSMWMSCCVNRRWKLTAPHILVSHSGVPMLTITEDTLGENYAGGGYCNAALNRIWHGSDNNATCEANLLATLSNLEVDASALTGDACFNIWMTVDYTAGGRWVIGPCRAGSSDHITFKAEQDLYLAISNCPAARTDTNNGSLKPIKVRQVRPGETSGEPT
jgi:uncharacterized protein YcgI (DUF1989 family)